MSAGPSTLDLLRAALAEDLGGAGDITSNAIFASSVRAQARIAAKADGVLSGGVLVEPLFAMIDAGVRVRVLVRDGARVTPRTVIAELDGPIRAILAGERTILNLLQRLSGVATMTAKMVTAMGDTRCRLLDTRKTIPTLRALEKQAVLDGGGCNHRFGLFDMVLIKDTHVAAAGGPGEAVRRVRSARAGMAPVKIEVEVQTAAQFDEALAERPERIMLDNMTPDLMKACVAKARASGVAVELEASGNVSLDTVASVAATGVDFVSAGCLTHSAPALDIHLVIV